MATIDVLAQHAPPAPRRVLVLMLPAVHALDFAGPVQAVYEANGFGACYELRYVGASREVRSAQGFVFSGIEPLPVVDQEDWILVPGIESTQLEQVDVPADWLRLATARSRRVSSICSGAFVLARAGVLEGRLCTTHWKILDKL